MDAAQERWVMLVTERTKDFLEARRSKRTTKEWASEGFVQISGNGNPLGRLVRGDWLGKRILESRVSPDGSEVWIKVS